MICTTPSTSEWNQEVVFASYSLFRGFLNAMDAEDSMCSRFFICEATKETSKLGWIGTSLANERSSSRVHLCKREGRRERGRGKR